MSEWLGNDELFKSQLGIGHKYSSLVADALRDHNLFVEVTPMVVRDTIQDRDLFNDEYDLLVAGRRRIEVKSRDVNFTDDPGLYPWPTIYVYSKRGWNAKKTLPVAVVLISQHTEAKIVIPTSSSGTWKEKMTRDNVRNIEYAVLVADRSVCKTFVELAEWLKRQQRG